jgi:hypothetical protein
MAWFGMVPKPSDVEYFSVHQISVLLSNFDLKSEVLRRGKEAGLVEADDSIPLKDAMFKLQAEMNNIKLVNHKK